MHCPIHVTAACTATCTATFTTNWLYCHLYRTDPQVSYGGDAITHSVLYDVVKNRTSTLPNEDIDVAVWPFKNRVVPHEYDTIRTHRIAAMRRERAAPREMIPAEDDGAVLG